MSMDQDIEYYLGFLQNLDPNDPYYDFKKAVIEEDLNRVISEQHDQMQMNRRRYDDEDKRHNEIEKEQVYFENLYYGS